MSIDDRKKDASFEALKAEFKADPESMVFVPLAQAHIERQEYDEAVSVARCGLRSHPDSSEGKLVLAIAKSERANRRVPAIEKEDIPDDGPWSRSKSGNSRPTTDPNPMGVSPQELKHIGAELALLVGLPSSDSPSGTEQGEGMATVAVSLSQICDEFPRTGGFGEADGGRKTLVAGSEGLGESVASGSAASGLASLPADGIQLRTRPISVANAVWEDVSVPELNVGSVQEDTQVKRVATFVAVGLFAVAALLLGYGLAVFGVGGRAKTKKELEAVAAYLERGGLASLIEAEKRVEGLLAKSPHLKSTLTGALAEIYARRYRFFGGGSRMRGLAQRELQKLEGEEPTVEHLFAMVLMASSEEDLARVQGLVEQGLKRFPESPKLWSGWSYHLGRGGRHDEALEVLHRSHVMNPHRRASLLALARWYGQRGVFGAAFGYYDLLQERTALDVEAVLERVVLGHTGGRDPRARRTVSQLKLLAQGDGQTAGDQAKTDAKNEALPKKRHEPIAKDEVGRASLVLAVYRLLNGHPKKALLALDRAGQAYPLSGNFKAAVAEVYLVMGEWEKALALYRAALEAENNKPAYLLGAAFANYASEARLSVGKNPRKKRRRSKGGTAALPFGTVGLVFDRFSHVQTTLRDDFLPVDEFRRVVEAEPVDDLAKALSRQVAVSLATRSFSLGAYPRALVYARHAVELGGGVKAQALLGQALLRMGKHGEAREVLQKALDQDPSHVDARLSLARSLMAVGKAVEALDVLSPLASSEVLVPSARVLMAKILLDKGDAVGAEEILSETRRFEVPDPNFYLLYGQIYHHLENEAEAISSYQTAMKLSPEIASLSAKDLSNKELALSSTHLYYLGRLQLPRHVSKGTGLLRASLKHRDAPGDAYYYLGKALLKKRATRREGKRLLREYIRVARAGDRKQEVVGLLKRR